MNAAIQRAADNVKASKKEIADLKSKLEELEAKWESACQRYPNFGQAAAETEKQEVSCNCYI